MLCKDDFFDPLGAFPCVTFRHDDADGTLSNTQTINNVATGSGYSVAETVPSGWDQSSATCDDGSPVTNIDVSSNETVTCTFTNRKRGQITLVKDAIPDDPQDFSFTAGGGLSPSSFSLDDDTDPALSNTRTFSNVPVGSGYSLAESIPSGWAQIGVADPDMTTYSDTTVSGGTQYFYRVRSSNGVGDSVYSGNANATTPASGRLISIASRISCGVTPRSSATRMWLWMCPLAARITVRSGWASLRARS